MAASPPPTEGPLQPAVPIPMAASPPPTEGPPPPAVPIPMAASPPPTEGPPPPAVPCSADTHLIPPTEIDVAKTKPRLAVMKAAAKTKLRLAVMKVAAKTKPRLAVMKPAAMDSTFWLRPSFQMGKATGARDWKIYPPHAGSACGKTFSLGRFGQFYLALRSLVIRALLLPVNKYWLECFWKLDPIRRALIIRVFVAMASMLILALAVPIVLLVIFHEQEMSQVWVMSLTLCSYAFLVSLFIWRDWWFYTDFVYLSYGPLLASYAATVIGPRTAIFILHWSTVWAAGYLGSSIALHRLHKETERGIDELPRLSCHSKYVTKELTILVSIRAFIVSVGWTMYMAMTVYGLNLTQELPIVLYLSCIGWIYVALWLYYVANVLMHGVLLKGPMRSLPYLVPCAMLSPAMMYLSVFLSVLLHWLLLMALVGFLGYHLAVYIRYLHTAAACETIALAGD